MLTFLARSAISSIFVFGGQAAMREPGGRTAMVEKAGRTVGLELDENEAATLVKLNGAVMAGAGATFALGILPRVSAAALIGSLVPTTLTGHAFWEEKDPAARKVQLTQFLKNAAIVGGLALVLFGGGKRDSAA